MLCFGLGAMLILMHVYGSSWCVQIQLTELILFGFNSFLNVPHASLFLTSLETPLLHTCQQSWLFITLCPNCLVLSVPILESSQEHTFLKCIQYLNEASSLNTQTPLRKIKSFSDQTTKTQSGWNPQMTSWLHTEHFVFTRKQKEEHFPVKKPTQKQRRILWVDTQVSFTRVAHTAKKPKTNSDMILTCSTCCTLTVGSLFLHWHLTFSYTTTADHIKHCRSLLCHLFCKFSL